MINSYDKSIMEKLCRSCMRETTDVRSLFEIKDALGDQSHLIADMFMACASVKVTKDDSLPKIICSQCELKLSVAYEFKQQCEKTDDALRKLVLGNLDEEIEIKPDVNDYYDDNGIGNVSDSYESNTSDRESYCKFCSKTFHSEQGFKLHMQRHKEKLHSCHICQKKFTKSHLHKHLQNTHKKDAESNSHICEECGSGFPKAYLLSKHMREEHKSKSIVENESDKGDNEDSELLKYGSLEDNAGEGSDKQTHKCKYCNKILTTPVGLKIHMRRHTGHNLHPCVICTKTFTKSNHLKRHMLTHGVKVEVKKPTDREKDKKVMQCEFCDRKFKYRKSFSHHMNSEHGISDDSDVPLSDLISSIKEESSPAQDVPAPVQENAEMPNEDVAANIDSIPDDEFLLMTKGTRCYTCHVCQAKFVRSNHLTRHMTFHRAVLVHKCDRCDKAFATPEYLAKHTQEDHIDKPYMCTICDKTYSRGEHLIRHLKTHLNPTEIDIKCSICEKEFTRSDHLARHIKLHLQQDKRHVCNECGKAFNRLDNLKTHQKIHTGQKDNSKCHLCIYCGKEFNNSSNMIVHMRRHTGERPYKCNQCGKGFPRSHDLKCHERTHSGEKPYMCTLCGKAFNKSNKLLRHTRVHTGERPYVCSLCGRAFTQSNDLALHMRRHTGARPYACGMCPARFIQSGQLKAHRRSTGHWMETQPDLKGGHRVEPVVPLTDPVPIKFKTHGKKKSEDEPPPPPPHKDEIKESPPPVCNPLNIVVHPIIIEETKLMPSHYRSNEIVVAAAGYSHATREEQHVGVVELVGNGVKCEGQNCATNKAMSNDNKEQIDLQNNPPAATFQIYSTNPSATNTYNYAAYQTFG